MGQNYPIGKLLWVKSHGMHGTVENYDLTGPFDTGQLGVTVKLTDGRRVNVVESDLEPIARGKKASPPSG